MPRILCVWFPLWPIQRQRSVQPELKQRPLALFERLSRGERLTVCSPAACRQGLRPGMSKAEAEGLMALPGPDQACLLPAEPEADRELLRQLALLCRERFSPKTALEEGERPECLFLDVQGCAHLFGGEPGLLQELVRFLREPGWRFRCALADTAGAAWGIARSAARRVSLIPPGNLEDCLRPLPVAALRLPEETLAPLAELGIHHVGALLNFPRAELTSRFGPQLLQRLRQALGVEPELLVPVSEPEPITACWNSEDPVSDQSVIEHICRPLLEQVLDACERRGVGLLQCRCRLEGGRGQAETYTVELIRPVHQPVHLLNLLGLQWEQRPFPTAVQRVVIDVTRTSGVSVPSGLLFEDDPRQGGRREVERFVERLSSRLGKTSVLRAALAPEALPEAAVTCRPWLEGSPVPGVRSRSRSRTGSQTAAASEPVPPLPWERPLTLLAPAPITVWSVVPHGPPQRVRWNGQLRAVWRWWGPERIETGWWEGRQHRRDYYRVELETGEWLWIFRGRPDGNWFLQGLFD